MMMINIVDTSMTIDGSLVATVVGSLIEAVDVDRVSTVSVEDTRMLELTMLLLINANNVYNIIKV